MRLKDIKIGTQIRMGLGAILLLVVLLGVLAWVQTNSLWLQTKGLYDHPVLVRRALGSLTNDILLMQLDMKDMVLAEDEQKRMSAISSLDTSEADAFQQFDILYDRYLGPRNDIDGARVSLVQWKSIRDETIRLARAGKAIEALRRTEAYGVEGGLLQRLWDSVQRISDFANGRADKFYQDAERQKASLQLQLILFVAVVLLLSLFVAWLMLKNIMTPVKTLTAATEQFRQDRLDIRSGYRSDSELGELSASFNSLADTIQTELKSRDNAAQVAQVIFGEEEVHAFCGQLLTALLEGTGSQLGAVYLLNPQKTAFEHFKSIGMGDAGGVAFSALGLEGELGAALATRRIQRITDIPADTRFTFAAVSGEFRPREILTIPVLSDHEVTAVISLASLRAYEAPSIRLVNDVWDVLSARLLGVLAYQKLKDITERLEHQNSELNAQKRELAAQADELTEQNSELELQKRQIQEANRLKSTFLSNMSHELRTPLNSVIALAGVLYRRLAGTLPMEEHGYLEVIERNGRNLLELINDILDLSRIEAGREEIRVSRFSVRELVGEIVAMLEPQAMEKKIALLDQLSGGLPLIASDLDKCRHILQNLLGNAVKFTEQGQVRITAESSAGTIRDPQSSIHISVTDTGIGMTADQLPHIFDEFRQADDSTSRKFGGTGLGLAIAKKYAVLLGGGITVESAPGKGSTFTLHLPLALEAENARPYKGRQTGPAPALRGQGQTILLVEDNGPAIIQLTDILQSEGYRVQVARNGKEALAQIEGAVPEAMILDLMMPEVDGFQVLKAIRGAERTAHLPVLILTAKHVTKEELSFLKGNHIHQLIQKGDINRTGLLAAVARMVAPRQEVPTPLPSRPRRPARPGRPVVLVVEDNPDSLRTAKALLNECYQVIEATDGQAGVEQARRHQPDLILMDIALPVMDGVQALQEIRKDATLRHIPVIALTASAMVGERETILAHGFDGYISKPIDAELLETTLREALD